jgi:ketosteroid isomerase-like protein
MTQNIEQEALATYRRYIAVRERIFRERRSWDELADFFTDDAVFIDPAWGRVEGRENIRQFMCESMQGLEDWTFPEVWTTVAGHRVVTMWEQRIGAEADGRRNTQPGISILYYAGDGRFCYELDLLNMAHVFEDLRSMKWRPGPGAQTPPEKPDRDWSLPAAWRHLEREA